MIGEADWAIINLNNDKFYTGTNELYNNQNLNNKLYNLFQTNISDQKQNQSPSLMERGVGEISEIAKTLAKKLEEKF